MKKFQIEVYETLARVIEVNAKDSEEAIQIVKEQYENATIILDSNDFVEVNYNDINLEE